MSHPPIQIVNDKDEPVGQASMDEAHEKGLLHRIVVVILQSPEGEILLQKRGPNVSTNQNVWDASSAGHVDAGENYLEAAEREMLEELGIKNVDLKELAYYRSQMEHDWRKIDRFRTDYIGTISKDTKVTINPGEITEAKWFSPQEIDDLARNHPEEIVNDFVLQLKKYELI